MMTDPENKTLAPEEDNSPDRKKFTWLGLGLLLALLLTVGLEALILLLTKDSGIPETSAVLLTELAMCFLAFPAGALLLRKAGKSTSPLGERKGFAVFAALLALTTEFGLGGQLLGMLFAPRNTETGSALSGAVWEALLYVFVTVIAEPVCEEFFFRRCLTDALRQWGWKTAVLLSALLYAFFHGSLTQFFFALGVGAVLSYAYLTTGKLRIPIAIHMFINFFFMALPTLSETFLCSSEIASELEKAVSVWVQSSYTDCEQLAQILSEHGGAVAALMVENLVGLLEMGLSLAGCAVLFFMQRKAVMQTGERKLSLRTVGDTVFLAPGIAAYILICVALAALTFLL